MRALGRFGVGCGCGLRKLKKIELSGKVACQFFFLSPPHNFWGLAVECGHHRGRLKFRAVSRSAFLVHLSPVRLPHSCIDCPNLSHTHARTQTRRHAHTHASYTPIPTHNRIVCSLKEVSNGACATFGGGEIIGTRPPLRSERGSAIPPLWTRPFEALHGFHKRYL